MSDAGEAVPQPGGLGRRRLPNRRPCLTETIVIGERAYACSVGFEPATGLPKELFLSGAKIGSDAQYEIEGIAIAVSKAMQRGIRAGDLAVGGNGSVIAAALDRAAYYEAEDWA